MAVNLVKIIEGLVKLHLNKNDRIIAPNMQDLYVNLPTEEKFILEVFSNYNSSQILNLSFIKLISECLRSCFLIYSTFVAAVVPQKTWISTKHNQIKGTQKKRG